MSVDNWEDPRLPWSSLAPAVAPDGLPPEVPSRLSQDLAALTRVLLGIAAEERPAREPLTAQNEPAAPASRAEPPLVDLSLTEHPLAPDGHQRLRSVLAELAFLDD